MCLPHDPPSFLRWLETQICVLSAWRDDLAADPAQRCRTREIEGGLLLLEREAERLRADLGVTPAFSTAGRATRY